MAGKDEQWKNKWTTKVGVLAKKVVGMRSKWYGQVMRREEHCVRRRVVEMKVRGGRKIGRSLDKVN